MSIALTGFLTGFAEGSTERIKREREENEAMIENRLKRAQTNRLLFQKEQDAQKQLYRTRYDSVSAYMPEGATEEQKLALISNDEIAKQFTQLRAKGEEVDLNKFLVMNKDKIPKNFSSVNQYIDSISVAPAPVAQEQVDAIRQTRGFLGSRTGANIEKAAQQFGTSAAQLLAYEEVSGVPVVPQFARMNVSMLNNEKTKDIDIRIKQAQSMYLDAREEFGEDSQEAKVAKSQYNNLMVLKEELEPEDVKWADYVGKLKMAIINGKPEQRAAAQREYDKVIALEKQSRDTGEGVGGKIPTANTLSGLLTRSATRAVTEKFGGDVAKNLIVDTAPDGNTSFRYIGTDPVARAQVLQTAREAMRYAVQPYLDMNGRPLNRDVDVALRTQGIQFDADGKAVFTLDEIPVEQPPAPAAAPTAAAVTTPAAAARTTTVASDGRSASGPITQAAAPAASTGDVYRFENLNPSQVEAVVKASGTGEGLSAAGVQRLLTNKDQFNSLPLEQRKRWFKAMNKLAPSSAPTNVRSFRSVEEAEAANLPKGTRITINGRRAEVQ